MLAVLFFAFITYALPLIDLIEEYRIKFFVIKKKHEFSTQFLKMLSSCIRYKATTFFLENSNEMKFQSKKGFCKHYFWGLNIMILQSMRFPIMDYWEHILQ